MPEPAKGSSTWDATCMHDEHTGLAVPQRRLAISAISLGVAVLVIDTNVANVALPTIARALKVDAAAATSVVTVYQLILVMGLLPFASLADKVSHRLMFRLGLIVFTLASMFSLLVASLPLLLTLRAAQGVGAGMAMSVATALIRDIYPAPKLGAGLGLNSLVIASAGAIAPTLGGFVISHLDWRWVFAAAAPLALASLALSKSLPDAHDKTHNMDVRALAGSSLMFLLLIGGIQIATHGHNPLTGIAISLLGLFLAVILVRYENRQQHPVLPVDLFKMSQYGRIVIANIFTFIATALTLIALPFVLERRYGFLPGTVGLLLLPFPLTLMVVTPLAASLSDRASAKQMGLFGLAAMLGGLWQLAVLPDSATKFDIAMRLAMTGAGFACFTPQNTRLLIGLAPRHRSAAAGGLVSTSRLLGQTVAGALAGVIFTFDKVEGVVPFFTAMLFVVLAAVCTVNLNRPGIAGGHSV